MKINLDIVNNVIYKYAKFYYDFFLYCGLHKITKFDKIYGFEIYILRSRHLFFIPKYKIFEHIFLHVYGINSYLHANKFFNFL
jgi:hypothetical protein